MTHNCCLTWIASKLKALVHYTNLVGLAAIDTKLWTRPGQLNVDGDQQTENNAQAQPQQKIQECQNHNLCVYVCMCILCSKCLNHAKPPATYACHF